MFERATTFWRASSTEDESTGPPPAGGRDAREGLTRAEARALSRCAPLTPAEFRERRRMVEQGLAPLSSVLDKGTDPGRP
jgi:hypothetical protein